MINCDQETISCRYNRYESEFGFQSGSIPDDMLGKVATKWVDSCVDDENANRQFLGVAITDSVGPLGSYV